jgi:hypothetical protein
MAGLERRSLKQKREATAPGSFSRLMDSRRTLSEGLRHGGEKMRISVPMAAAFVLLLPASAFATGTLRIVQNDGSAQTYSGVVMKIKGHTLTMTSADQVSTVTVAVSGADCAPTGGLIYCTGGRMSLQQRGKVNVFPFKAAKFYVNSTDQEQSPDALANVLSAAGCQAASKVGPHSVVFAVLTEKGTRIIGNGKLD